MSEAVLGVIGDAPIPADDTPAVGEAARQSTFGAQTAGRAFVVLRAIVESDTPLTLAELAETVGLNKSATYRLTREMEEQNLISVTPGRTYVPATGLYALAARVMNRLDVRRVAHPYLLRASELTGETIGLHLRHGRSRVCIDVVEGVHPVRRFLTLGETFQLYDGPSGKAMLAFLPDYEAAALLAAAERAGKDRRHIEAQTGQIRAQGYLAAVGDQHAGVGGLSVPVFGPAGVVASITVSGPGDRWNLAAMEAAASEILALAANCSRALGATPPGVFSRYGG